MQKPGSPVKWEGNLVGVGGERLPPALQRPAAPGAQRLPGHPVPTVKSPADYLSHDDQARGQAGNRWAGPGGSAGRGGAQKRFPETKAAVRHIHSWVCLCLLLPLIP